jgi:hypothetical protein
MSWLPSSAITKLLCHTTLVLALALSACGGTTYAEAALPLSDAASTAADVAVHGGERRRAQFATTLDADKEINLDGPERNYLDLLPGNPPSQSYGPYRYRYYPQSGLSASVAADGLCAMGSRCGNTRVRELPRTANWRDTVTNPAAGCWNLRLPFTAGVRLEAELNTCAFQGQDVDNADAHAYSSFEGQRALQFDTLESWTGADGLTRSVPASVWRLRTGEFEVSTSGRNYNELTLRVRTRESPVVTVSEPRRTAFVDCRLSLQPGQQLTQARNVSGIRNEMGATPADSRYIRIDRVDMLTTRVVRRETVIAPAGRFDTCRLEDTDSATPGRVVATWVLQGVGLPVRRVVVDGGVVTLDQQARFVSINCERMQSGAAAARFRKAGTICWRGLEQARQGPKYLFADL